MNLFARLDEIPTMTLQDIMETKRYGRTCVPFRITKGKISNRIGPWPLLFIENICLVDINMFARFDERK